MSLATLIAGSPTVSELLAGNPNIKIVDADESMNTAEFVIKPASRVSRAGLAAIVAALGVGYMPRRSRSNEFHWRNRTPISVVPMTEHEPCARAKRRNRHKGGA